MRHRPPSGLLEHERREWLANHRRLRKLRGQVARHRRREERARRERLKAQYYGRWLEKAQKAFERGDLDAAESFIAPVRAYMHRVGHPLSSRAPSVHAPQAPRRRDRRLACGRPRVRRRSTRARPSDPDDPEPGPGSGLLTRLLHPVRIQRERRAERSAR